MNTQEYIESLIEISKYLIVAYSIGESDIILFVDDIIPSQSEIPTTLDGRDVKIVKSI